jgi:hypothetical protein
VLEKISVIGGRNAPVLELSRLIRVIEVASGAVLVSRNKLPSGGVGGWYVVNAEGRRAAPEAMLEAGSAGTQFML